MTSKSSSILVAVLTTVMLSGAVSFGLSNNAFAQGHNVGDDKFQTGSNNPATVHGSNNPATVHGSNNPATVHGSNNPATVHGSKQNPRF